MKIEQLAYLAENPSKLGSLSKVSLLGNNEFTNSLKHGQMLQGQISKDLGQGRYLVTLSGKDVIAETSIPFSKNDLLYGRVVGIGEHVEIQRIEAGPKSLSKEFAEQATPQQSVFANKNEQVLVNLFGKFKATPSVTDKNKLLSFLATVSFPTNGALAGLVVHKMGLPLTASLLNAVYKVIDSKNKALMFAPKVEQYLSLVHSNGYQQHSKVSDLKPLSEQVSVFSQMLPEKYFVDNLAKNKKINIADSEQESTLSDDFNKKDKGGNFANLSRWLLNLQVEDSSVSHSVFSLPLFINDKLLNIDIAIFDQKKSYSTVDGVRYRQIHFSLDNEALGPIEVSLKISDNRIRVNVMTERHEVTDFMASHMSVLKTMLKQNDWLLDEISYGTVLNGSSNAVVDSVVEHYISQDSLSRLV